MTKNHLIRFLTLFLILSLTVTTAQAAQPAEDTILEEIGCDSNTEDGEILLLAKYIAVEAGSGKLDQLMTASVIVNRVHSSEFIQDSLISVILAAHPQYGSDYIELLKNANPTEQMLASARQVLNGEFAIPSNVVFETLTIQNPVYLYSFDQRGSVHYYSCIGEPNNTDICGRTALTASQALETARILYQKT